MHTSDGTQTIEVRSAWNGWRTAEVHVADLHQLHWLRPSGAPRAMVHGYVLCSKIIAGDLAHDCCCTPGPHRLLVCVLKRNVAPSVYTELARLADTWTPASLDTPAPTRPRVQVRRFAEHPA